ASFGLAIDLEIDVLENGAVFRQRTVFGVLHAGLRLFLRLFAQFLEFLLGEDAFGDEPALEDLDGVVVFLVGLDLVARAIATLVLGIRDGVTVVTIGVELEDGRLGAVVRAFDRRLHRGAHFVNILAAGLRPIDKKSLATLGEAIFDDRRTL